MWLQWDFCGAYDAQRSVQVDSQGRAWVQRGSYHSRAPRPVAVHMQRLRDYCQQLDAAAALAERVEGAAAAAGVSHLRLEDGRVWTWAGILPATPSPLRDCIAYLNQL